MAIYLAKQGSLRGSLKYFLYPCTWVYPVAGTAYVPGRDKRIRLHVEPQVAYNIFQSGRAIARPAVDGPPA